MDGSVSSVMSEFDHWGAEALAHGDIDALLDFQHKAPAARQAHPRTEHFKEDIIQAFYDGIKHKPATTFGNVKADVIRDKDPSFKPGNFCSVIRQSAWKG